MSTNSLKSRVKLLLVLSLFAWLGACDRQDALVGTYSAITSGTSDPVAATLELHADGKGFWSIETDNAPFRWDVQKGKIRLHTQSGGVIQGILDRDIIQIELPQSGIIRFKRNR